ncbi:MAG: hypothetical protein ACOCVR_00635 [Myxococcota bacterium]
MRAPRLHAIVLGLLAAMAAACGGTDFERSTEVTDLRVLAMRLDPPEVEAPLDESSEPVPVRVTALIASPTGEPTLWQLSTCATMHSMGCGSEDPEAEIEVSAVTSGTAPELPEGAAPELVVSAEHRFTPEELFAMVESVGSQGFAGTRPVFELIAISGEQSEIAAKRLQVSLPDAAYRMLLSQAGIPICDSYGLPEGCLDYRTRIPNTNPEIEEVRYRRASREGEESELRLFPADGPLLVSPGETLHIEPSAAEGSAESHQTLTIQMEDRTVSLEDREEMLIWSWFVTAGEPSRSRTEQRHTSGELNVWTAPEEVPGDGDLWIWIVLRDNRGGVDFTTLHLKVEE